MSSESLREQILAAVRAYADEELIQVAWEEFYDFNCPVEVKAGVEDDLRAAEHQLRTQAVLSMQGRGRLRSFVFAKRFQEQLQLSRSR